MRVVVSFTTIPSRVEQLRPMLESIFVQTRKPDRFVLWVPALCHKECEVYRWPNDLLKWALVNGLEIQNCGNDLGPATKLIPTILSEPDPDTILITVDDDVAYEHHAIEELVAASEKWPTVSFGFMGGLPGPTFLHAEQLNTRGEEWYSASVLGGYRGILYRRRMFDAGIVAELEELLKDGPFVVDDQFFGWYLFRKGVGRFILRTRWPGLNGSLNFKFLNLGRGIYDNDPKKLAEQSIQRLEAMYARKGWPHP